MRLTRPARPLRGKKETSATAEQSNQIGDELTSTVGRVEGEVNVLLRVEANDERGHVDDLLADADVALADQDAGVVDRLGEARLEDLGLEAALEEVLDLQGKHVIEAHALLVEHTDADEAADEGVSLKEALGVLLVELEELTGRTADLGQDERDAPDLALVAETELSSELELGVEAGRLEGTARDLQEEEAQQQEQMDEYLEVGMAGRRGFPKD